jgi:hypothetical protein
MASTHQSITYSSDELRKLFGTTVIEGEIISIDAGNNEAEVSTTAYGTQTAPFYFHCGNSETVDNGNMAFEVSDDVYILCDGAMNDAGTPDLYILCPVDGIRECITLLIEPGKENGDKLFMNAATEATQVVTVTTGSTAGYTLMKANYNPIPAQRTYSYRYFAKQAASCKTVVIFENWMHSYYVPIYSHIPYIDGGSITIYDHDGAYGATPIFTWSMGGGLLVGPIVMNGIISADGLTFCAYVMYYDVSNNATMNIWKYSRSAIGDAFVLGTNIQYTDYDDIIPSGWSYLDRLASFGQFSNLAPPAIDFDLNLYYQNYNYYIVKHNPIARTVNTTYKSIGVSNKWTACDWDTVEDTLRHMHIDHRHHSSPAYFGATSPQHHSEVPKAQAFFRSGSVNPLSTDFTGAGFFTSACEPILYPTVDRVDQVVHRFYNGTSANIMGTCDGIYPGAGQYVNANANTMHSICLRSPDKAFFGGYGKTLTVEKFNHLRKASDSGVVDIEGEWTPTYAGQVDPLLGLELEKQII